MAVADTVEVVLDVETTKYLSDLNRADKEFARITGNMEREAIQAGAAFSSLKIPPINPKPIQDAERAIKGVGGQLGNLGGQFQDIAIQLQSGTSPFTIALQQGTQISAALGQAGAGGAVKALGAAFVSILSPVSLATIAIIALGGVAIQWLSSVIPKTETATEAINRHAESIKKIITGYDGAETALNEYLNTAGRLPQAAAQLELAEEFAKANKEVDEFRGRAASLGGVLSGSLAAVDQEIGKLLTDFSEGRISAGELSVELTRIGNTDLGPLGFLIKNMISDLNQGAIAAANMENALINLSFVAAELARSADLQFRLDADVESFQGAIDTIKGLTPELRTQKQIIEETYNSALAEALTEPARQQLQAAKETALAAQTEVEARRLAEEATRKQAAASKTLTDQTAREREGVLALIETLQFEQSLIGLSAEQKAVQIALRRAGATATDEERAAIEALVLATAEEVAALKDAEELYKAIKGVAEQSLKGFLHDLAEGKTLGEAFSNVLDDVLSKLIDFGVGLALDAIFPGLGSIAGRRAAGGPVSSGRTYLVGERGPELFTPTNAGTITSNSDAANMAGGAGGKVAIYLGPGLEASLLDQSARQSIEIVQSMTPAMIQQGSATAVAKSNRDRVA